jgi:hypothetical protein
LTVNSHQGIGQVVFLDLDGMLDFIRSFGAMPDDESRPAKKDGAGGSDMIMG